MKLEISAVQPVVASWALPVDAYFRRSGSGWTLVGLERHLPEDQNRPQSE